jgi:hypothetical protein
MDLNTLVLKVKSTLASMQENPIKIFQLELVLFGILLYLYFFKSNTKFVTYASATLFGLLLYQNFYNSEGEDGTRTNMNTRPNVRPMNQIQAQQQDLEQWHAQTFQKPPDVSDALFQGSSVSRSVGRVLSKPTSHDFWSSVAYSSIGGKSVQPCTRGFSSFNTLQVHDEGFDARFG